MFIEHLGTLDTMLFHFQRMVRRSFMALNYCSKNNESPQTGNAESTEL
jgi:hypothetical protein